MFRLASRASAALDSSNACTALHNLLPIERFILSFGGNLRTENLLSAGSASSSLVNVRLAFRCPMFNVMDELAGQSFSLRCAGIRPSLAGLILCGLFEPPSSLLIPRFWEEELFARLLVFTPNLHQGAGPSARYPWTPTLSRSFFCSAPLFTVRRRGGSVLCDLKY